MEAFTLEIYKKWVSLLLKGEIFSIKNAPKQVFQRIINQIFLLENQLLEIVKSLFQEYGLLIENKVPLSLPDPSMYQDHLCQKYKSGK